jgi:hypothetical protein
VFYIFGFGEGRVGEWVGSCNSESREWCYEHITLHHMFEFWDLLSSIIHSVIVIQTIEDEDEQ